MPSLPIQERATMRFFQWEDNKNYIRAELLVGQGIIDALVPISSFGMDFAEIIEQPDAILRDFPVVIQLDSLDPGNVLFIETIEGYQSSGQHDPEPFELIIDDVFDAVVIDSAVYFPAHLGRVVDGDTVWAVTYFDESEERIRLVGIDAPDLNKTNPSLPEEMGAQESLKFLESLIGVKDTFIQIEKTVDASSPTGFKVDSYGRTLAIIHSNGVNVNRAMVRSGHAKLSYLPEDRFFNDHDLQTWSEFDPDQDFPKPRAKEKDRPASASQASISKESSVKPQQKADKSPRGQDSPFTISNDEKLAWSDGVLWDDPIDNRERIRDYPSGMPGELWIGDCRFRIPPLSIQVQQSNNSNRITPLRSKGSLQSQPGSTQMRITVDLFFRSPSDINGYEIWQETWDESASGTKTIDLPYSYYVDGLRPLIAQFQLFPFLPVKNKFLNETMSIDAVALHNMNVRTVPGFPNVLQATIEMTRFDMSSYIYEEDDFAAMFNWPLFRWHVQQKLIPAQFKERKNAVWLKPISSSGLSNNFTFGFVPGKLAGEHGILDSVENIDDQIEAHGRAQSVMQGLLGMVENEWEPRNASQKRYANAEVIKTALEQYESWAEKERKIDLSAFQKNRYFYSNFFTEGNGGKVLPKFILPLYDPVELGYDQEFLDVLEEIADPAFKDRWKGKTAYLVDPENTALLERVQKTWVAYYEYLKDEASLVESDLKVMAYPIPNLHLVSLEFTLDNILTTLQMDGHEVPTHQFIGALDTYARLTFETNSEEAVAKLQMLLSYSRAMARQSKNGVMAGFIGFENDLARIFGMDSVLIEDVNISNIPGMPGSYQVEVLVFDFKRTQRNLEEFHKLSGRTEELERISEPGNKSWHKIVEAMKDLEAYPDLELPTYNELAAFLSKVGIKTRFPKNRGKYVDPDFFLKRTRRATESLHEILKEPMTMKLSGHDIAPGDLIVDEYDMGDYDLEPPKSVPLDVNELMDSIVQTEVIKFDTYDGRATLYAKETRSGPIMPYYVDEDIISDELLQEFYAHGVGQDIAIPVCFIYKGSRIYWVDEGEGLEGEEYIGPQPDSAVDVFNDSHFDMMFMHDKRGRLVRAFPAFGFFLVDEGEEQGIYRIFDTLYGIGSVISIDTSRSRENAADLAVITFTDMYRKMHALRGARVLDPLKTAVTDKPPWWSINPDPDEALLGAREEGLDVFELLPGARVHLRLGYGSNLSSYPTVFNGTIAEIDPGEITTVVCQGDGAELANHPQRVSKSSSKTEDPRDAIVDLLMSQDNFIRRQIRQASEGRYMPPPNSGVEHFGRPVIPDGHVFDALKNISIGAAIGTTTMSIPGAVGAAGVMAAVEASKAVARGFDSAIHTIREWKKDRPWYEGDLGDNMYKANGLGEFNKLPQDAFGPKWWLFTLLMPFSAMKKTSDLKVAIDRQGMSMWDIIQTYALCTPDYMVSAEPFQFRSTLFFGKPYFGLAYDYADGYTPSKSDDLDQRIKEEQRRKNLVRRSYCQFYYVDSYTDIIRNNISASKEFIYTNVNAIYATSRGQGVAEVHADTDLKPRNQKTVTVNAPIVASSFGMKLVGKVSRQVSDFVDTFWGNQAPNNFAAGVLADYMKQMYQGQLMILGMPSIKPGDLLHINDSDQEMFGPVQVRASTTTFSVETGMVTTITPDACVYIDDPYLPSFALWGSTVATGMAVQSVFWTLHRTGVLSSLIQFIVDRVSTTSAVQIIQGLIGGQLASLTVDVKALLSDIYEDLAVWATGVWGGAYRASAAARGATHLVETVGSSALAKGTLVGLAKFILFAWAADGVFVMGKQTLGNWVKRLENRQAVTMVLMNWKGQEFAAGIEGHEGLVYGDTGGTVDQWIEKLSFGKIQYGGGGQ